MRISSTNVIKYTSSSLEAWNNFWKKSRLSHHFFLWSQSLFGRLTSFFPQNEEAWLLKLLKIAEEDPSWAAGFLETFPELPVVSRVVVGDPESRPCFSLQLGAITGWLGTCDTPELLAVSGSWNSFAFANEFTWSCNSRWICFSSRLTVFGSLSCRRDKSPICNLQAWFASTWQVLRNSWISWFVLTCSSFPCLHTNSSSLSLSLWAWSAHWPSAIRVLDDPQQKRIRIFSVPYPCFQGEIQHQITFSELPFVLQLRFQLSFRGVHGDLVHLLNYDLDQLVFLTSFSRPTLATDSSNLTGFPVLEDDSMTDSYPCTGIPVQDNESKFTNADTVHRFSKWALPK